MKKTVFPVFALLLIAALAVTCTQKPAVKPAVKSSYSTYGYDSLVKNPEAETSEILYGLITPTEVTAIFSRLKVPYNEQIINPSTNIDLYTSNAKASLNLGIYGVDFGYIKMFGIGQKMIYYGQSILNMSNKLGIPDKYLTGPIMRMQKGSDSPDTIMALVNRSYKEIEDHLRKDGRESTAGLMLMGGWVEALYITTQLLYDPQNPDKQVIEKIAQQKYTLNSLLNFMRNYYDDPVVVYYTKKLIYLKRYFDTFDIYFKIGDLSIDQNRKVLKASGCDMTISRETLESIRNYARKLRTEMVTP
jgi:hypothetical protein